MHLHFVGLGIGDELGDIVLLRPTALLAVGDHINFLLHAGTFAKDVNGAFQRGQHVRAVVAYAGAINFLLHLVEVKGGHLDHILRPIRGQQETGGGTAGQGIQSGLGCQARLLKGGLIIVILQIHAERIIQHHHATHRSRAHNGIACGQCRSSQCQCQQRHDGATDEQQQ